jgi:endonuclease III
MGKDIPSIIEKLGKMHGQPRAELHYSNPMELTVATILSAQCTDERVNRVTESLFKKYRSWQSYMEVSQEELEEDVRPTGFYKNKAKSLKSIAGEVTERFGGKVPEDIDLFATVKGVGRKSANMIVGLAHGKPAMIVDTHVARVSRRAGLTIHDEPETIEEDLKKQVPKARWLDFCLLLILHGRYICKAKKPECTRCLLRDDCDYWLGGLGNV